MEKELIEHGFSMNRRRFFTGVGMGIGSMALGSFREPGDGDMFFSKLEPNAESMPRDKRLISLPS
jgi:hypothetical protein